MRKSAKATYILGQREYYIIWNPYEILTQNRKTKTLNTTQMKFWPRIEKSKHWAQADEILTNMKPWNWIWNRKNIINIMFKQITEEKEERIGEKGCCGRRCYLQKLRKRRWWSDRALAETGDRLRRSCCGDRRWVVTGCAI